MEWGGQKREGLSRMPNEAKAGTRGAPLHVHVKTSPDSEAVFRITPELFEQAMARHPALADRVSVSFNAGLEGFADAMVDADVLVTWDLPRKDVAGYAPRLKWIHVIGAGIEHLQPLDWLPSGVALINNKGVHAPKAGEYGLMALLMLNSAMPQLITQQRAHRYREIFTGTLTGKTLLIVGLGEMGSAVARAARLHGLEIQAIRRGGEESPLADAVHRPDALDTLLPQADFLLLTTPLTEETRGLIDQRRLALLKPSAGLINMSRAGVVDYAALADALTSGQLAGALLDVFDPEPLPADSPLWDVPNLIMTPHVSSDDLDAYIPRTLDLLFENLRHHFAGEPLKNRVRPELGY